MFRPCLVFTAFYLDPYRLQSLPSQNTLSDTCILDHAASLRHFGLLYRPKPALRGWILQHDSVFTTYCMSCQQCSLPALSSPMPAMNPFSSACPVYPMGILIQCRVESRVWGIGFGERLGRVRNTELFVLYLTPSRNMTLNPAL